DAGDFEVAAASQADALELLRPLLDEDAPLVSRITFVALLQNHGTALVKLGRLEEGIEILREAIDRLTPLVAAFPDQSAFLRILADTWNSLGLAYSNLSRGDGRELEAYREAVAVHRRYAERGSGELGPFDGFTLALSNLA